MKPIITTTFLILFFSNLFAQVKIGGTPEAPVPSAVLELDGGNNRGLLLPRMRKAQIDAIQNPAEGLTIYATDEQAVYLRKSLVWEKQEPLTLPYIRLNDSDGGSFYIGNTSNSTSGTGIHGHSYYGSGIFGSSSYGRGVTGSALSAEAEGGAFINNYGGTALVCGGPFDIFDTKTDPLIRFAGPENVYRGFIQLFANDMRIGTLAGNNNGRFVVRTNGLDRLWVDSVGYVTIGGKIGPTISGPYKLAVKGKIAATDFNVVASGSWPDYVFSPSYKLRSLEETEAYINEHKHLPNIPAAAVVDKEGFALGDMQKRMMEKIEELTLYLIEANKNIQRQQKEIDLLKKKLK
jgi:hypothetical protein